MNHRFARGLPLPLLLALAGACAGPSQNAKKTDSTNEKQEFVVATNSQNAVVTNTHNAVPPQPGEVLICDYEQTVGSHIPKRICRSKSEVERLQDETQQALRTFRDSPPPPEPTPSRNPLAPGH